MKVMRGVSDSQAIESCQKEHYVLLRYIHVLCYLCNSQLYIATRRSSYALEDADATCSSE